MSGAPAIAAASSEFVYFATVAKGTNGSFNTGTTYDIVIGKVSPQGTLIWMKIFPELQTTTNESEPALILGPSNELYVAFVTLGATSGNINMADIPTFCNPCPVSDYHDIVLARIDETAAPNTPTVTWRIQSAALNSCAKETAPQLAIDKKNQLLYVTVQSTLAVQCLTPIGPTNTFLGCFSFNGIFQWSAGGLHINGTGNNTNPVLAADELGQVYLAQEITSTIVGGTVTTTKQVEVIQYKSTLSAPGSVTSYNRQWVLSGLTSQLRPIEPTATSSQPSVIADPEGNLYIAFITTGTLPGKTKINAQNDLVLACVRRDGTVKWVQQGAVLNGPTWQYNNCSLPQITRDNAGNIYASVLTTVTGSAQNIVVFKADPNTGRMLWKYDSTREAYLLARSGAPNGLFPSVPNAYSKTTIARYGGNIYMALTTTQNLPTLSHTSAGRDFCLMAFVERNYAIGHTPYTYIESRTICNCGGHCSCSSS